MKLSILYYSVNGNTKYMAEAIEKGAGSVEGITAKTMSITEIDEAFLQESSCVILGTPTYYASMTAETKMWLDKEFCKYPLGGKLGGAFATAAYVHGGADLAIQGILTHMLVAGMLVYSSGGACGNPPIHLGPVALDEGRDQYKGTFEEYGRRMAEKTRELFQ